MKRANLHFCSGDRRCRGPLFVKSAFFLRKKQKKTARDVFKIEIIVFTGRRVAFSLCRQQTMKRREREREREKSCSFDSVSFSIINALLWQFLIQYVNSISSYYAEHWWIWQNSKRWQSSSLVQFRGQTSQYTNDPGLNILPSETLENLKLKVQFGSHDKVAPSSEWNTHISQDAAVMRPSRA